MTGVVTPYTQDPKDIPAAEMYQDQLIDLKQHFNAAALDRSHEQSEKKDGVPVESRANFGRHHCVCQERLEPGTVDA
jgi:hypothetical protein